MNLERRTENISALSIRLYPFAYALIPDDLHAHQLVIDTISKIGLDENALSWTWKDFARACYQLAVKRNAQVKWKKNNLNSEVFFKMKLSVRAALFLRHRESCESEVGAFIMEISPAEFLGHVYQGRDFLSLSIDN